MAKGQNLIPFHLAYASAGKLAAASPPSGKQLALMNIVLTNRSGGAANGGILVRLAQPSWTLSTYANAGPTATDVSATIKAGSAVNIFNGVVNDGFLLQSDRPINMIGLNISTAAAGGTFEYSYFDGTSFVVLPTISVPADYNTAGTNLIMIGAPNDWVAGTGGTITGADESLYAVRVRAIAAAPTVAANDLWLGKFLVFQPQLADNGTLSLGFEEGHPLILEASEGVMPYFATANAGNMISGFYTIIE